jgi:hypothetical protein
VASSQRRYADVVVPDDPGPRVEQTSEDQVEETARCFSVYHGVRFYENEKSLSHIVAAFLCEGLAGNNPGIVVAVPSQRAAILRALHARSVDVVRLQRSGDLLLLDGDDMLATFMVDDKPDPDRFRSGMTERIQRVCGGRQCTVRIYGQMVDILWKKGMKEAAIRLELLWNYLANTQSFSLLCGYSLGHFYYDVGMDEICRQHTHVVSADGKSEAVA